MFFGKDIYFDQAATSYPKPRSVIRAVRDGLRTGGNPGRSGHRLSVRAALAVYEVREALCTFFDAPFPEGVVFTQNATHAINLGIHALLGDGSSSFTPHVLYSDMEHNAVVRPLYHLVKEGRIIAEEYPSADGARGVKARLRPETRLIVATHASNICGRVLPITEIGAVAKKAGVRFLVDASQSAGHLPLSVKQMGIDVLCLPAHKGLYGPLGVGTAIFAAPRDSYPPFLLGGSGVNSLSSEMPAVLPERFEAGSLSLPAILGFGAAISYCDKIGVEEMRHRVSLLEARLALLLSETAGITVTLPKEHGSGILSFTSARLTPERLAERLDGHGIAVRAGLHCAPVAHRTLGTVHFGTVRVGLGHTNTVKECERFARTLKDILSSVSPNGK